MLHPPRWKCWRIFFWPRCEVLRSPHGRSRARSSRAFFLPVVLRLRERRLWFRFFYSCSALMVTCMACLVVSVRQFRRIPNHRYSRPTVNSAPHFGELGHSLVVLAFLGFRHFDGVDFIGSTVIHGGSDRNLYGVVGGSADCFHVFGSCWRCVVQLGGQYAPLLIPSIGKSNKDEFFSRVENPPF